MDVFKKNSQLIVIFFVWLLSGYAGPLVYAVIPATLFIFKRRNQYLELIIGFFFILVLSDSREGSLQWAVNAKDEYILMLAMFLLMDRKSFRPFNYFYQKFIPFFIIAFICLFFTPSEILFTAIEKTLSYLFLLLIISNYLERCHKDYGTWFYKTLIYFGISILVIGFILKFVNNEQAYLESRFRGMLGNPNGLGVFVLMLFLLYSVINEMYPKLFTNREKQVIYLSIFLSLLLSGSRNCIFAVIIFFFFSYFYKLSPFLGFILFAILLASYQYISQNLVNIIEGLGLNDYFRVNTLSDASGRYVAWSFAKDQIKESIWLGKGFEYTNYLYYVNSEWLSNLGHQGNAHNSYLTLWLDTGFFGLVAYMWAFLSSFFKAMRKSKLAIPIMYAVVFSTVFESWLTASLNPFTIQLFMILSILTSEQIIPSKAPVAIPV
jgi:O-antigen ligase